MKKLFRLIYLLFALSAVFTVGPVQSQGIFQQLIADKAPVFETEYQAVLTRATVLGYTLPSPAEQVVQNQMVVSLKAAGIWVKLDVFYPMLTNINFATLNWVAPSSFQLTLVNSPTYNAATGFEGNGTTSYLSTNWDPGTNGVQFTLNDCGMGALNANDLSNSTMLYGSANGGNTSSMYIQPRLTSTLTSRINQSTTSTTGTNTNSIGRYHQQRTASTTLAIFKNGSSIITGSTVSVARTTSDTAILANNINGTYSNFSTRQIRYFWAGASMTTLEATFDTILDIYY